MALHVRHSNHLERLAGLLLADTRNVGAALADRDRSELRAVDLGPLGPKAHVVVPNFNIKAYLDYEIARREGVSLGTNYRSIEQFLRELMPERVEREVDGESVDFEVELLSPELTLELLVDALRPERLADDPALAPVRTYLAEAPDDDLRDRKRYQLASRIAEMFREYRSSRPEMLHAWPDGPYLDDEQLRETERWQRALWLELFGPDGRLRAYEREQETIFADPEHLGTEYGRVDVELDHLPAAVHVFALSYAFPVYAPVFRHLDERDIHLFLYALNPCAEKWDEIVTDWHEEREQLLSSEPVEGGAIDRYDSEHDYWQALDRAQRPPDALRLWGRAGRDAIYFVEELADHATDRVEAFVDPKSRRRAADAPDGGEAAGHLLNQIQRDILQFERRTSPREDFGDRFAGDRSLQVLGCPDPRRELEVVADEIWALVGGERDGFEAGELAFNDIAVIVNHRRREEYQTHLESVFGGAQHLPYNLIDLQTSRESRLLEAVDLLFSLPFGDFERSDLLKLLTHPNLVANHPEADPEQWLEWCEELNILHGADRRDHRETYIDEDLYNWDQGLKRLVLGAFMADERAGAGSERIFRLDEYAYLPRELPASAIPSAARLVKTARMLIAEARRKRRETKSLGEWADELADWARRHLAAAEGEQAYDVVDLTERLRGIGEADLTGEPVSYRIVYEMAREKIEEMQMRRGHYLIDGVVVSSFQPMRPLPFEVVFVTGMGEGDFPTSDPKSPLDLRRASWKRGDARQRDKDRYMFLETLVSTRRRLYMSYVSRDARTGDPLEPSTIVRELQSIVDHGYLDPEDAPEPAPAPGSQEVDGEAERHWTETRHPLRRYAPAYFDEAREAFAAPTNEEAYRERAAADLREALAEACGGRGSELPSLEALESAMDGGDWQETRELLRVVDPPAEPPEEELETLSLRLSQIRKFLESPLQAGARHLLGLRADDEEDPYEQAHEPFESGPLEETMLLRRVFNRAMTDPASAADPDFEARYREVARRMELAGRIPSGIFHELEREQHLEVLATWRANLGAFEVPEGEPLEIARFGRGYGDLYTGRIHDSIAFDCEIEWHGESRRVEVELHGDTQPLGAGRRATLAFATGSRGRLAREKNFLRGFVDAVVLAAAGLLEGGARLQLACNHGKSIGGRWADSYRRTIRTLGRDEALDYLRTIVAEMYRGPHDYLLPVEVAVDSGLAQKDAPAALVEQYVRGGRHNSTSNRYGPIPNPEDYRVPDDAETIVERRFGPYFSSIVAGEQGGGE